MNGRKKNKCGHFGRNLSKDEATRVPNQRWDEIEVRLLGSGNVENIHLANMESVTVGLNTVLWLGKKVKVNFILKEIIMAKRGEKLIVQLFL